MSASAEVTATVRVAGMEPDEAEDYIRACLMSEPDVTVESVHGHARRDHPDTAEAAP